MNIVHYISGMDLLALYRLDRTTPVNEFSPSKNQPYFGCPFFFPKAENCDAGRTKVKVQPVALLLSFVIQIGV